MALAFVGVYRRTGHESYLQPNLVLSIFVAGVRQVRRLHHLFQGMERMLDILDSSSGLR